MGSLIAFGISLVGVPLLTKLDPNGAKKRPHDPIFIGSGLLLMIAGAVAYLI